MRSAVFLALSALFAPAALGQAPAPVTVPGAAPTSGFRAEFLAQLDATEKKLVSLAEAVPAEKYGWRPAEGVRSVGEVYVHVATANYFIPRFAGIDPPAGIDRQAEKHITDKSKIIPFLKESFEHLRKGVIGLKDADLDRPVKMFGMETTVRGALLLVATHMHEHLGQSIAYARSNGVVPPWTAEQERKAKAAPKKEG